MVYIYSEHKTKRLQYTCEVLFKSVLDTDFKIVDQSTFEKIENEPKINYSSKIIENAINIVPQSLLFEENIVDQGIQVHWQNNIPYFFKTSQLSEIEYDIFSMLFYMVSRYEEYLPFEPDVHGRFSAKISIAYKANFLELPVVHLWANELIKYVLAKYPTYTFPEKKFSQINSIDIDIAYHVKGKPLTRQLGGFVKSLFRFDFQDIKQRFQFYTTGKDIFDTYYFIEQSIKKSNIPTVFFIELGKHGKFDKNLPLNSILKNLIHRLSKIGEVGIHPSYQSNSNIDELKREINSLSKVLEKKTTLSRQHFLKLLFPATYENLIANGITTDYTMGYADQIGFRAGMCVPYPFFNLKMNEIRPLTLVPFQIMEGTLKDYMQLDMENAIKKVKEMKENIKSVKGTFVSIFHNSTLSNEGEWKDWIKIYENILSND